MWINQTTIRQAEQRVNLYIRSSWEIYDSKLGRIQAAAGVLARSKLISSYWQTRGPSMWLVDADDLGINRIEQNMDILNVLDAQGRVLCGRGAGAPRRLARQ